jgi:hypothetical protein
MAPSGIEPAATFRFVAQYDMCSIRKNDTRACPYSFIVLYCVKLDDGYV